jgi:GYF domain 2
MNNLNETTPLIRVSDAIYIFQDGKQEGPFTRQQLEAMWAAASVSDVSLAWREGMPDWAPLNTILPPNDPSECNAVNHEQREAKALPHHRQRDARKATESPGVKLLPRAAHPSKPNQSTENRELNAKIEQPSANSSRTEQAEGLSVRRYLLIQLCSGIGVELIAILLMGVLPSDVLAAGITGALALCIVQMSLFLIWWSYTKKLSTVESKDTTQGQIRIQPFGRRSF